LVSFRGFFEDYIFAMVKYLSFHNSSFCLKILFNVNGKAHPLFIFALTEPLLAPQVSSWSIFSMVVGVTTIP